MYTEILKLTQITENEKNPRKITSENLKRLVDSMLVFPKMLEIRPIVVDNINTPLGGNMRIRALNYIATLDIEQIKARIQSNEVMAGKTSRDKKKIISYWEKWLNEKTAYIVRADSLSESEKNQFIAKDNISYGEWDEKSLSEIGENVLKNWGLDIDLNSDVSAPTTTNQVTSKEENKGAEIEESALPEELRGVDMKADELPKYEGTEETKFDYIAISYRDSEREEVAKALKCEVDKLFSKVCWNIDSYLQIREA